MSLYTLTCIQLYNKKIKIINLQYTAVYTMLRKFKASKKVSGSLHLTGKETLNAELYWDSMQVKQNFLGLSIFHGIARNEKQPLI